MRIQVFISKAFERLTIETILISLPDIIVKITEYKLSMAVT